MPSDQDSLFDFHSGLKEEQGSDISKPDYDKWLARGRNVNTAAIIALIGVGIFYFFSQTLFLIIGIIVSGLANKILLTPKDVSTLLSTSMDLIIEPIRWALLLSEYLALLLPTIFLIRRWHTSRVRQYVRLKGAPIFEIILAVAGIILILPIGSYITNTLQQSYHFNSDMQEMIEKVFTAHSLPEFIFLVFVVAVTPAICEEFFFRGYIQRTFERSMGVNSIVFVGVIFGLFHFEPLGLITLSLIGIWLGYIYYRSKSLLPNMAAHFTNNFIALWLAYRSPVIFGVDAQNDQQIPFVWVAATLPLFAFVVWIYHRYTATRIDFSLDLPA